MARWGPKASGSKHWETAKEVRSYLATLDTAEDSEDEMTSLLGPMLRGRLLAYLADIGVTNSPPQATNQHRILLDAVYYRAAAPGTIRGEYADLRYDRDNCKIWDYSRVLKPIDEPQDRIIVMGVTEIYESLLFGTNRGLNPFRSDPALRPVLGDERFTVLPTVEAARAAAVRLIEITEAVEDAVGPPSQCMLLGFDGMIEDLALK
jgi:hypothetical protein